MAERTGHDLMGTAVVTLAEGQRMGRVEDVTFDGAAGIITGFLVSVSGLFNKPRFLPISQVQSLGADAITVQNENALQESAPISAGQTEFSAKSLKDRPVLSASGSVLGKVADYLVDDQALTVALSLGTGLLGDVLHGRPRLPVSGTQAIGKDSIVVPDSYDPKASTSH